MNKYDVRGYTISNRKVILLDLDGTLLNWNKSVESYRHTLDGDNTSLSLEQIYRRCKLSESFEFWDQIEWLPWGKDLYNFCQSLAYTVICSSPSDHPNSAAGKVSWLNREIKHGDWILTKCKWALASPRHLLIDDNKKKCDRFYSAGGPSILIDYNGNTDEYINKLKSAIERWVSL